MKSTLALALLCGALLANAAQANEPLAARRNCLNCHGLEERKIRLYPSYREVARKYAGQPGAEALLVKKVLAGGNGSFGALHMPAQKGIVTEDEARVLVKWILTVK